MKDNVYPTKYQISYMDNQDHSETTSNKTEVNTDTEGSTNSGSGSGCTGSGSNEPKVSTEEITGTEGNTEIPLVRTFQEKLQESQLKHSLEQKMHALIDHIARVIEQKKSNLQRRLLRNPNEPLILIRKEELSNSNMFSIMLGWGGYPYYVHPTQDFYSMFGLELHMYSSKYSPRNKWTEVLRQKVITILELGKAECCLGLFRGSSIFSKLPDNFDPSHRICLIMKPKEE